MRPTNINQSKEVHRLDNYDFSNAIKMPRLKVV